MFNKTKIDSQAIWRSFMKVLEFWNRIFYFPLNLVIKLWRWVYDEE